MTNIHAAKILILDFGSQTTQLIARRVREIGVYCEIRAFDISTAELAAFNPHGIILSGGPETVTMAGTPRVSDAVFNAGVPVFGICYGMQAMAAQLGGEVGVSEQAGEFGHAQLRLHGHGQLFQGIEDAFDDGQALLDVWMNHGDRVVDLPAGFHIIAATDNAPVAAMADETRHFYGVQFHPEVTHTRQGLRILQRFVVDICACPALWRARNIIDDMIAQVKNTVGTEKVLLGLSGGVDSSVVAALLHRAIGNQLICVFVDNGLLRQHEAQQVLTTFGRHMGLNLIHVDASKRFLKALKGISDPEQKRKIAGREFIHVFQAEAKKLTGVRWLAQGTIYPDVIESAASKTGKASVIKTHHNVGGLPENMPFELIEPLRELFKDEVRTLGLELGLASEMVYRHPFPGPGLMVRIPGEVTKAAADTLRAADAIFMEELVSHDLYQQVSQAFAVLLPVNSVGITGDSRHYAPVIALRAVETVDFMTARWVRFPYDFLDHVSARITNEVPGVSRVVYDISSKPPATIEWE